MDGRVQPHDVVAQAGAARGDHHLHAEVLAELLADLAGLQRELAGRNQNHGCGDKVSIQLGFIRAPIQCLQRKNALAQHQAAADAHRAPPARARTLNLVLAGVDPLQQRYGERGRLACAQSLPQ